MSGEPVAAVVFDVGETILARDLEYRMWAGFFGVTPHTFSAVFGAMIAKGAPVTAVVERFGAGRPFAELYAERTDRLGPVPPVTDADLYPDARRTIAALREAGAVVGIAGNQPTSIGEQLRRLELGADFVASSQEWAVAKPDPRFFARVERESGVPAAQTVYVGDQLRNDVAAPSAAGFGAVWLRRGPWGLIEHDPAVQAQAVAVVDSLDELVGVLTPRIAPRTGTS